LLTACGGSNNNSSPSPAPTAEPTATPEPTPIATPEPTSEPTPTATPEPAPTATPEPGSIVGPLSTGSREKPMYVYYDLDNAAVVDLTEEEAAFNNDWDIAFNRTKVLLNFSASTPVSAYFTGNNADFLDASGNPVADKFIAATVESELADFTAVTASDIPADDQFVVDSEELTIGGKFYNYDFATHTVSAADDKRFIVQSNGNYSKIRAKSITTAGRTMASLTLGVAFQDVGMGDTEFMSEVDMVIDAVDCASDIYIDLDTKQTVEETADWDLSLPCVTVPPDVGAGFELHLSEASTAIEDSGAGYAGIDPASASFMGFNSNIQQIRFFDDHQWYQYNLQGFHQLYSQFGVYLIKTATATYKFQIVSYYDAEAVSGNYSFRFEEISSAAP